MLCVGSQAICDQRAGTWAVGAGPCPPQWQHKWQHSRQSGGLGDTNTATYLSYRRHRAGLHRRSLSPSVNSSTLGCRRRLRSIPQALGSRATGSVFPSTLFQHMHTELEVSAVQVQECPGCLKSGPTFFKAHRWVAVLQKHAV